MPFFIYMQYPVIFLLQQLRRTSDTGQVHFLAELTGASAAVGVQVGGICECVFQRLR